MTKPQRMQLEVHYYDDNWGSRYFYLVSNYNSTLVLWLASYGRVLAPGCASMFNDYVCSAQRVYLSHVDSRLIKRRLRLRKASKCRK